MDILLIFGERLAELMFDNNITTVILAKNLGIDVTNIRRYLRKVSLPTLPNAIKIANYFNCSLDFLCGLDGENCNHTFLQVPPFSESFRKILGANNCTRYKLQKESRISAQLIDDWFNGIRTPNLYNVVILAHFFDCSLDSLIGREKYF